MRESWDEMRARSKKWPYPDYTIIPVAGSLLGDMPALRGKTSREANAVVERMLKQSGAKRKRP